MVSWKPLCYYQSPDIGKLYPNINRKSDKKKQYETTRKNRLMRRKTIAII